MAIALSPSRPKLASVLAYAASVVAKTPTESGSKIRLRVVLDDVTVDNSTVACTTTNGSATVTSSAAFGNVRVGDGISGTGIPGGATVTAKASTSSITISANATASGSITATITPGQVDSTIYILELNHEVTGAGIKVTPTLYIFDGTRVSDTSGSNDDNATVSDASGNTVLPSTVIDIDTFLTNARVARTNS